MATIDPASPITDPTTDPNAWVRWWARYKRASRPLQIGLGCGALLVACGLCSATVGALGNASRSPSAPGVAQASNTSSATATTMPNPATPTTAPPTATPKPKGWATTQHFTGSQNTQTTTFHVPDGARIVWTETLTNTAYNQFSLEMYNSDGTLNDLIVNNANDSANQTSTYNVHGDLDVYLKVSADQVQYDIAVQVYQ